MPGIHFAHGRGLLPGIASLTWEAGLCAAGRQFDRNAFHKPWWSGRFLKMVDSFGWVSKGKRKQDQPLAKIPAALRAARTKSQARNL